MSEDKVLVTKEGYEKLLRDLEHLKTTKRREIADDIARARAFGDLKENAEYDSAKNNQAMNEKRIADLQDTIARVQIIDDSKIAKDTVLIGAIVKLKDLDSNEEITY